MGMAPPPRVLPEGVPADAEPVTEDQIERLPDYAQQILEQYMHGMSLTTTSREELERLRAAFFASAPVIPPATAESGARACGEKTLASNSTACEDEVDEESMRVE